MYQARARLNKSSETQRHNTHTSLSKLKSEKTHNHTTYALKIKGLTS